MQAVLYDMANLSALHALAATSSFFTQLWGWIGLCRLDFSGIYVHHVRILARLWFGCPVAASGISGVVLVWQAEALLS
jgi:hypothetical protein